MSDVDANEWLMSSGVKSAAFPAIGAYVSGFICRQPEVTQQRDPATNDPKFWNDGKPMLQLRVVLQTEERDPEDEEDTGERAIYVRANMQKAVAQAVREAKAAGLQVGGKLFVRYTGDDAPKQRGFNGAKRYEAKYRAPQPEVVAVPDEPASAPASQPAANSKAPNLDAVPF